MEELLNLAFLLVGLVTIVPVGFLIYDRFFRIKHRIRVEHGNVTFFRLISGTAERNDKLVLMILGLNIINSSQESYTLKELVLRYKDGVIEKEALPYNIPIGNIKDWQAIAATNTIDTVVIHWKNILEVLSNCAVLQPGQLVSGNALFILDASKESMRDIKDFSIVIRDFLGHVTTHHNKAKESWYQSIDKGFALVDAPVSKDGDSIQWQGIQLSRRHQD